MHAKLLLPATALLALTLAACDNKPANPPATTTTTTPSSDTITITVPTPEAAMESVQKQLDQMGAQVSQMTQEQKVNAVATARKTAEDLAKAQGLSDTDVKKAGDVAEASAKKMLGVQ